MEDSEMYAADWDHSSLRWSFAMGSTSPTLPIPFNTLKAISNWASFTSTLEKRLASSVEFFSGLPSSAQGTFLTAELRAVGKSTSPGRIDSNAYRSPISRKIKSLLSHKKFLRMSLRGVKVALLTIATDLRKQIERCVLESEETILCWFSEAEKENEGYLMQQRPKSPEIILGLN